jgi:hypothetical protein
MTVCARQIAELTEIDLKNLGPAAVELEVLSGKSFGKTIHQMSDVREKTSDQKILSKATAPSQPKSIPARSFLLLRSNWSAQQSGLLSVPVKVEEDVSP